jgi:hypothetical protein
VKAIIQTILTLVLLLPAAAQEAKQQEATGTQSEADLRRQYADVSNKLRNRRLQLSIEDKRIVEMKKQIVDLNAQILARMDQDKEFAELTSRHAELRKKMQVTFHRNRSLRQQRSVPTAAKQATARAAPKATIQALTPPPPPAPKDTVK